MSTLFFFTAMALAASINLYADGTHKTKIDFANSTRWKLQVQVYNGKDHALTVPHKVYYVGRGGKRTLKCHGQGTHKCWVRIVEAGNSDNKCKNERWSERDILEIENSDCKAAEVEPGL